MDITINNFKAINKETTFNINDINIITGKNSGGKSTLLQALLLIKQSVESNDPHKPLKLNQPYVALGKFRDISTSNCNHGRIHFKLTFRDDDIKALKMENRKGKEVSRLEVSFDIESVKQKYDYKDYINSYKIKITDLSGNNHSLELRRKRGLLYEIETNSYDYFVLDLGLLNFDDVDDVVQNNTASEQIKTSLANISFKGLFPRDVTFRDARQAFFSHRLHFPENIINEFLATIYYIGPLRESPKNYYYSEEEYITGVGTKGEYTPQLLAKKINSEVENVILDKNGNPTGILFNQSFIDAIRYWACDVFKLAKNIEIKAEPNGVIYRIMIKNGSNKSYPINNVGFGVSQLLPIIVQGLILPKNSLLLLEQPEIHLHPSLQAKLFDFILSLQKKGINTLVETHSDHFITRLRRRIVEDNTNEVSNSINLTFVGEKDGMQNYELLNMDDMGNLTYWPEGFFDQYESDIQAIVKAQITKRKEQRKIKNESSVNL